MPPAKGHARHVCVSGMCGMAPEEVGGGATKWHSCAMKRLGQSLVLTLAVCTSPNSLAAQNRTAKPADSGPLVVDITTLAPGRVVEVENKKTKMMDRKTVDRDLLWSVDKKELNTIDLLGKQLSQFATNPKSLRPDPTTGGRRLASLRINPGPHVHWDEVVRTYDKSMAAGFEKVVLGGVDSHFIGLMAKASSIVDKASLIVPGALFCTPDELASKLRPTVDIHRDGHIVIGKLRFFDVKANQATDLEALKKELRRMRAQMKEVGEVGSRPGKKGTWIDMPVLIRIDVETHWGNVLRLLRELAKPEIGFWKHQFAVAEIISRLR